MINTKHWRAFFLGISATLLHFSVVSQNMHEKHKPITWNATFSNDLKYLSTNGSDGYGYIWDLQKGESIDKITPEDGKNAQIFISHDGALKLIRSNGKIKVYSLADNQLKHEFSDENILNIYGISSNGHKIIARSTILGNPIISINIDGSGTQELLTHKEYSGLRFTSDMNYIIFTKPDKEYHKYDKSFKLDVTTNKRTSITSKGNEFEELEDVFGAGINYFVGRQKNQKIFVFDRKGNVKNDGAYIYSYSYYFNLNVDFTNDESILITTTHQIDQGKIEENGKLKFYVKLYDVESGSSLHSFMLDDGRWTLPAISEDKKTFSILYQDYKRQGAAVAFYDVKTGKETNVVYIQNGPAYFSYYDPQKEKEDALMKQKKQKEAEELSKKFHCVGYKIVNSTDPKYKITIFYTGIVSFKSERKQSDLQQGVTCKCGDKAKLQEEIQILENTAKQKKGILILDASLISNSEIFRDKK